jgi:serine/threonine protein kinase
MEPLSANDPRMIGEFRLHAQLGAGGMGQVYLGFSPAGRAVAIKVIHPQYARDQEFLRRFSHEVAAASAVGGMYTAPVVDYDLRDSPPWLATAYVPGPTLDTVVSRHGPLPEAAIWRLAAGLTEALRAVHAKGLVHRDLKPANVLLADNGPHVIDFGISRASSSMTQLTSAGMAIGTPGYMSPEQAQTQVAGPPSDIFSLGCVLAYAATGQPPFAGENPASILFRIVTADPDLSMIPPGLRQVIDACLQKNPASRPEPGRLIAMFNELGPATPVTLGSFWPEAVARVIAADQASQTPAGLTPPEPFAGPTGAGSGRLPGSANFTAPTPGERTPTALATPPPGPVTSATGHAPMIHDGYYAAAAQGRPASPQAPSGPSVPPMSAPPAPYGTQQPYGIQSPTGQAPAASYPGQGASYPGQGSYSAQTPSYSGQQPGSGDALSQYAPARRKPTSDEVPRGVHTAIRLMYLGFVVTALNALLSLTVLGRYNRAGKDAQAAAAKFSLRGNTLRATAETNIWQHQNQLAGLMVILLVADILGLACWAWLAVATRRGHGWTRIGGTVLLAVYSIATLFVLSRTENDLDVEFTTVVVWALGVAAVIPLWSQQAGEFFAAWRKH